MKTITSISASTIIKAALVTGILAWVASDLHLLIDLISQLK